MARINVLLFVESRYKVQRKRIVAAITKFLTGNGISSDVEVSIAIVGDRKMRALNNTYRHLDKTSNVLSFPIAEGDTIAMPSDTLRLGDVVISYPEVVRESAAENWLVDDRIEELVIHGVTHLLGIHHE
ncbi:MAG: rRNA maturation RNase YbeY [Candidatus Levybacteria bacterium]|nr:rRNA maturation RNase YbeY [Candidatus Levybacteria bacterium]